MSHYVFPEPSDWNFDKLGHRGKLFDANASVMRSSYLIVEIDGQLPSWLTQHMCDFVYYVLDGTGTFVVEGRTERCVQGDLVTVPAGSRFTYQGNLRMLLTSTPPWTAGQEELIDFSGNSLWDETTKSESGSSQSQPQNIR
ncbi:cupin domain-containing protein [Sphaerisporangium aureirubrum]|uniref:Cupin domain-containing protein n=1 Tax=Sphaerisporangium aureirubrum TaxID=1544736 RepID=A0ABW1NAK8_9ACTN